VFSIHYLVPPWLQDHHLGGRTILPAVESMRLMATAHASIRPGSRPNCVLRARFLRLPEIVAGEREVEFFVDMAQEQEKLQLTLLRRVVRGRVKRLLSCVELFFAEEQDSTQPCMPLQPDTAELCLAARQVYQELVPLGPAFQSLTGEVWLAGDAAGGQVHALPGLAQDEEHATWLGSLFPLDGAMHVACVHGQRLASFVPFPVALERRRIYQATRPGQSYQVQVQLRCQEQDVLIYDLWLANEGQVYEEVQGLVMRDVSGGRLQSPAWLRRRVQSEYSTALVAAQLGWFCPNTCCTGCCGSIPCQAKRRSMTIRTSQRQKMSVYSAPERYMPARKTRCDRP